MLQDDINITFFVNRNYNLPSFADDNTLVIASSYSGNTEETISVLQEAIEKKCNVVVITTGGKAAKIANDNNIPVVKLKEGYQPRYALGLSLFSLIVVLQELGLISEQNLFIEKSIELWKNRSAQFSSENNFAFESAQSLIGFTPVIYSVAGLTSSAGYRLKCQLNENSKLHAFHNVVPEMNHNEIVGWESYIEKSFPAIIVNISDSSCHPRILKRFDFLNELFSKANIDVINLISNENNFKGRLMDLIYLCDWISFYVALQRGYDPSEIDNIINLKNRLA